MQTGKGRVLMAAPTYAGKEYALDAWVEGFRSQTYPDKHAYQVDNTRVSQAYFDLLKTKGIDVSHLTPWPDWDRTFLRCWQLILDRARALDCYWIMSVEADNVPAPEAMERMVDLALASRVHLITHSYPMHKAAAQAAGIPENSFYYNELGCMLMTRSLLERVIEEFEEWGQIVIAIFAANDRYHGGYIKLTNLFEVKHLDGFSMAYANLGPSEIAGGFFPGAMPADTATELPPSLRESA